MRRADYGFLGFFGAKDSVVGRNRVFSYYQDSFVKISNYGFKAVEKSLFYYWKTNHALNWDMFWSNTFKQAIMSSHNILFISSCRNQNCTTTMAHYLELEEGQ